MNLRHFTKVVNGVPMYDAAGRTIIITPLTNTLAYVSTDDPEILKTFDKFITGRIGGITEVSEAELEELKKKAPGSSPSNEFYGGPQRAVDTASTPPPPPSPAELAAAAVGSTMKPLAEEVSQLRADLAALQQKTAGGKLENDIPPPTPPAVGRRPAAGTPVKA